MWHRRSSAHVRIELAIFAYSLWLCSCLLFTVTTGYAADPMQIPANRVDGAELVGSWDLVNEVDLGSCRTATLEISTSRETGASNASETDLDLLYGVEKRICADGVYRLYYVGRLFFLNKRNLISLNPRPKDPIEKEDGRVNLVDYSPDRLTLWLSVDACGLDGSRHDQRGRTGLLQVKKKSCQ